MGLLNVYVLIWNDLCQMLILRYFIFILLTLKAWAASTMNQSEIRGLVRQERTRADIDILRRKLCVLRSRVQLVKDEPVAQDTRKWLCCAHAIKHHYS